MKYTRQDYNLALQQTNDEQMLLNLVRLRYRDNPQFLEVSAISSSLTLSFKSALNTVTNPNNIRFNEIFPNPTFKHEYTEKPTISYSPLSGEQFIKRLLTPITLDKVFLLNRSGWGTERVMRLCVQRINTVKNAPSASGPTPEYAPEYKAFLKAGQIFRRLQKSDQIRLRLGKYEGNTVLAMKIDPSSHELAQILQLPIERNEYFFADDTLEGRLFHIETRSLLGVLYFLSQSVQTPQAHQLMGKVTITLNDGGQPFDWGAVVGSLMKIQVSENRPENAYISINYRDYWFYISDSDLNSKSTFNLVSQLFSLQAGEVKTNVPVLTIPVGT